MDWEGLVRAIAALLILLVGFPMLLGRGGKSNATSEAAQVGIQAFHNIIGLLLPLLALIVIVALVAALLTRRAAAIPSRRGEPVDHVSRKASATASANDKPSSKEAIDALDWHQLERLVGELFRSGGYGVEMRGGANADGGIDLVVTMDELSMPVQCKHWKTWTCGVAVVREFLGAMKVGGFSQGYLVAREFSSDARELALAHGVALIDRDGLIDWLEKCLQAGSLSVEKALYHPEKLCPKCGSRMVPRTARKGKNAGNQFWGCSQYPKCNQILE